MADVCDRWLPSDGLPERSMLAVRIFWLFG